MKIYIVRHGECNSNLNRIYNNENEDLNSTGIKQAEKLREKIKDLDYDIIISSPLKRAKHTADIINVLNRKIITDDRLKERNPGNLSGKSYEITNREEYWNYYSTTKYGTSEDINLFFERIYNFLNELKQKDYEKVLITCHSGVSKAFYSYFNGIEDGKFLNKGLKNCEIKEYIL